MKFHTFHTYDNLIAYLKDFEDILEIYENIKYFLFYLSMLFPDDEKIFQKNEEFENISENFIGELQRFYSYLYRNSHPHLEISIKEKLKQGGKIPYRLSLRNFLKDLEFYQGKNQEFFEKKFLFESHLRALHSDFQIFKNHIFHPEFFPETEQKLEQSAKFLFQFIDVRTGLHLLLNTKSVMDVVLYESFFEWKDAQVMMEVLQGQEKFFQKTPQEMVLKKLSIQEVLELTEQVLMNFDPVLGEFFQKFSQGNIHFIHAENDSHSSFTTGIANKEPKIFIALEGDFRDVLTLIHEFGHAYQMHVSHWVNRLEFPSSIFMSEFCASFCECILMDFCQKNWEFATEYEYLVANLYQKMKYFLETFYFENTLYNAYLEKKFNNEIEFIDFLKKNNFFEEKYLFQWNVYENPYYEMSYIFAYLSAHSVFSEKEGLRKFKRVAIWGGSQSVRRIFTFEGIKISQKDFYRNGLKRIFSLK